MDKYTRMKELVELLNRASEAYYQKDTELMSNHEYDGLYDELIQLENETGTILANSPTQRVGYEVLSELPKEEHASPMLSLDKTKSQEELGDWLKDQEGLLSYKLDGLTIVLTYHDGRLLKAVTRGNGIIGEVITNNARTFKNLPAQIPYNGDLVLRGEAIIRYSDFEKINEALPVEAKYKNPRNLCSGSVRQLNNEVTARRNVRFYAFALISAPIKTSFSKKSQELDWLEMQGFECVGRRLVTKDSLPEDIQAFAGTLETNDIASDGLVLTYNDKEYSSSLGTTSKFPKDSLAFKWEDETRETTLREVFWSASRTGLINPVAIFDPVELEGTQVARASLHNISILQKLQLGIGDRIEVYKANMIIPQIADNLTRSGNLEIPSSCPVCGSQTIIDELADVKVLTCPNPECAAKKVKGFAHFVSRNAMNIEGLSEASLEKLIQLGLLHELADLYSLDDPIKKETIIALEGFGEKSYQKMIEAIERSRVVKMANFIYALGVLHVGLSNAKLLVNAYKGDFEAIRRAGVEELSAIEGFGEVIAKSLYEYFHDATKEEALNRLLQYVSFEKENFETEGAVLEGKVFVITGSLETYENRKAMKEVIESLGGKVTGSVSSKTDYLVNNDVTSGSSKNKKAKELGIPIIDEVEFRRMIE